MQFLTGSKRTMPSSRDDIDEAAFAAEFPAQLPPTPQPIPVAVPRLAGYQLQHIGLDYRPREAPPTDVPDGDFTTDITYTTDEGSLMTTSVPPSDSGSPNMTRRHAHLQSVSPAHMAGHGHVHFQRNQSPSHIPSQSSQETYPMQSLYTHVTPRSQRMAYGSHDMSHDVGVSPNQSVRSYDHRSLPRDNRRGRGQAYDYTDYHGNDHRERSRSASKDYRVYEHERERYYSNGGAREYRSSSPGHHGVRAIATGLDNSLVQAIAQMGGQSSTTPTHGVRSAAGSRNGHRRRRRRYQGQPHHMTSHQRYRGGPSDQDLTSASEAEQSYTRHAPARSLPLSPAHHAPARSLPLSPAHLTDTDEHDYATLPRVTPSQQYAHAPPTPSQQPAPPTHAAGSRVAQLKVQRPKEGHYDYPRIFQQSPPTSPHASTPSHLTAVTPPTLPTVGTPPTLPTAVTPPTLPTAVIPPTAPTPVTPPTAPTHCTVVTPPTPPTHHTVVTPPTPLMPPPETTPTNKPSRYEHLTPLKLSPVEGSPLSSRKHPPSPLALQSRSSGEVTTFHPPPMHN